MRGINALGVSVLALAGAAQADTVNLRFVGTGATRDVRVTIGSSTFNTEAGQLMHAFTAGTGVAAPLNGTTQVTFCTDLTQYVSSGGSTYTVAPIANLPQSPGWPAMGATRAQAVYNLYSIANGAQNASGADANYAAAFQIVLWEIVYDYNGSGSSLNLSAGNVRVRATNGSALSGPILTDVTSLFSAVAASPNVQQVGLLGLSNSGCQDQIVQTSIVPLPLGASLGLVGLGLAAAFRARRR